MALNKAKIITVTSVKGGTGKTTTVLNLAGLLSTMQLKTIIIDLDLYSGAVAASLNLQTPNTIYTLVEDLMNNRFDQMEEYTYNYNEYIDIIASPIDPRSSSKINAKFVEIIINRLSLKYDVILIDTNHIIDSINLVAYDLSTLILYIINNDLMDIKNMKTMNAIYEDMGLNTYRIILNEAKYSAANYSKYDIQNMLGRDIDYIIPKNFYNNKISKYIENGKIMTLDKGILKSKGVEVLRKILNEK